MPQREPTRDQSKGERRQTDRSSLLPDRVPRVEAPRPRPNSMGAIVLAAAAGVAITVASSALGRCNDDAPRAERAPRVTPDTSAGR